MRSQVLVLLALLLHICLVVNALGDYAVDGVSSDTEHTIDGSNNSGELQLQDESVFNLMKAQVMNDLKLVGMLIPPQVKAYVVHVYGRLRSDGANIVKGLVGEMLATLGRLVNKLSSKVVQFGEKLKEKSEKGTNDDTDEDAHDEPPTVVEIEYMEQSRYMEDDEGNDDYDIVEI